MAEHPWQSGLKNYLVFWKPSISRRLTISFTIFGLLIGYAVMIFLAVSATDSFIKLASNIARQKISVLAADGKGDKSDELIKLLEMSRSDLAGSARDLHGILSQVKFDLYVQEAGEWRRMFAGDQGVVLSRKVTDRSLVSELEKAGGSKIQTSSQIFWGTRDNVNVKLNITRKEDRNIYILSFDVYRMSLMRLLQNNVDKAFIFFAALLIVSHTLGHFFSLYLAGPIKRLANEATVIASGQYDKRFTTGRRDEIGTLAEALNNMASRIIDGTRERENLLIGILKALTRSIDAKSPWTAGHSERVTALAESIGRRLHLDEDQMRVLSIAAILHDIGKIAVPEPILDKPEKLTEEEFRVIRTHPQVGATILSSIPSYETILPGVLHHHERWDGKGYPRSIRGTDIPLNARIICIADVYDALTADRPYRKAWSVQQTMQFFEEQKEQMFDPELVDIFKGFVAESGEAEFAGKA